MERKAAATLPAPHIFVPGRWGYYERRGQLKLSSVKIRFFLSIQVGIGRVASGKISRRPNSTRKRGA
jgi:hypothetical protein